jgi:hypothetical protein
MHRLMLVALLGLVAWPAEAQRVQDARLAGRLDAGTLTRVEQLIDSARAAGLPTEPLVQKALEGASKRATGERILQAVRALSSQFAIARSALGPRTGETELSAAAGALQVGATPEMLEALREPRPEGALTVPLITLADLIARGVPADSAFAAIHLLVAAGATDMQLGEVRRRIETDIAAGAPPALAAMVRARATVPTGARPAGARPPAMPSRHQP